MIIVLHYEKPRSLMSGKPFSFFYSIWSFLEVRAHNPLEAAEVSVNTEVYFFFFVIPANLTTNYYISKIRIEKLYILLFVPTADFSAPIHL